MKALRRFFMRLTGFITRRRDEARLREEIEEHLALQTTENIRAGLAPDDARRQAVLKFGAVEALKESYRDQRTLPFFEQVFQDTRYALRGLRKNPGFATVAILTLALGIGANTAMFAVVNAVLLKPLPFTDPERLMLVHLRSPVGGRETGTYRDAIWSYPKYRTFLDLQQAFENTAIFSARDRDLTLSGDNGAESVRGEVVTDRYPGVLGITPVLGRPFTGEEAHRPGVPAVALIGHSLWTRRYGADPAILGRRIEINAIPHTIVGVLPQGFRGLSGNAEVWVPFAAHDARYITLRYLHAYSLVARRKSDISEAQAIAAVQMIGPQIAAEYSNGDGKLWGASAASLYSSRVDSDLRRAAWVLLGAVGLVLLIACVNLTNLLTAKALGRRREIAVRTAIGASRTRVARQFLVESLVLAVFGSALGIIVAAIFLDIAVSLLPDADVFFRTPIAPGTPRIAGAAGLARVSANMIGLDAATLLFTCVVAAVVSMLISAMPAMQSASLRPVEAIKSGGRSGTTGVQGFRARGMLVSAQIALALILLAGAALMIKSSARLHSTAIGVNSNRVVTARIDLPSGPSGYSLERRAVFWAQLLDRLHVLPGVESVGAANCAPVSGECSDTSAGFDRTQKRTGGVGVHWASPEYFSTIGIQLRHGRFFTDEDRLGRPKVVLVNEAAARAFWPNADPIGQFITLGMSGFESGAEVVGVVSDVRHTAIESAPIPDAYIPLLQAPVGRIRLFVRGRLDQASLVGAIRRELTQLDANVPLAQIKTMEARVDDAMWRTRVAAWLFSAFAVLALVLTAIGIFGVMSQTVLQRTSEIGVRMALGAQSRDVFGLMLGRAAIITGMGIVLGVLSAVALTRLMTGLLYQVKPEDPSTLATVAGLLGFIALLACYIPARRAARVDPLVALRYE
jgi:putative ABC transport system permease protein